jgi:hypothetical protein
MSEKEELLEIRQLLQMAIRKIEIITDLFEEEYKEINGNN